MATLRGEVTMSRPQLPCAAIVSLANSSCIDRVLTGKVRPRGVNEFNALSQAKLKLFGVA